MATQSVGQAKRRPRAAKLQLVRLNGAPVSAKPRLSQDTVRCLRALLKDAEAGKVVGISVGCLMSDGQPTYSFGGEAQRHPDVAAALSSTVMHGAMRRIFGEDE
ncbi:MAG TPA: hypothetical protein VIN06_13590 [Devosia sp.]